MPDASNAQQFIADLHERLGRLAETRSFTIEDVLSVVTGCMLTPGGLDAVADVIGWMTRERPQTGSDIQMRIQGQHCRSYLVEWFPELLDVDISSVSIDDDDPDVDEETWRQWRQRTVERFGERIPVPRITREDVRRRADAMNNSGAECSMRGVVVTEVRMPADQWQAEYCTGVLDFYADGRLAWTGPGSMTPGPPVKVCGRGDYILVDGENAEHWLRVYVEPDKLPNVTRACAVRFPRRV